MDTNMGMLPPSISFSISNNLILTSFIFTFKLNFKFNFTFELRNKNKKNGLQKKQKKTRFFCKKNDSFFLIYNTTGNTVKKNTQHLLYCPNYCRTHACQAADLLQYMHVKH